MIRRMFGWALSRDIVPASPCVAVKAPAKERRRDRVLSADEIAALWRAFDNPELAMSLAIRLALKLQLVTAQRKGEIIGAERSEFDRDGRVWTIPAEKAKNGMPHRVPLSLLALALLDDIEVATGRRPDPRKEGPPRWLFPSPRAGKPITGPAVDHAMRDNRGILGTGDATPHDLRRTAASHMTSIGISRLVVAKILNHAEPGVTAIYDRHSYDAEKRAALAAWGARLEEIISARTEPATSCGSGHSAQLEREALKSETPTGWPVIVASNVLESQPRRTTRRSPASYRDTEIERDRARARESNKGTKKMRKRELKIRALNYRRSVARSWAGPNSQMMTFDA